MRSRAETYLLEILERCELARVEAQISEDGLAVHVLQQLEAEIKSWMSLPDFLEKQ